MPAYKVPCPKCSQFIMRDVAVCPFCRTADPFAPARCTSCRTVLEDPRWTACPRCGTAVPGQAVPATARATDVPAGAVHPDGAPDAASAPPTAPQAPAGPATASNAPSSPVARVGACAGCGAPLATGARFCTVCGTIAG